MEKKMNNKGFSLVELIIVVAIMAVLIGVLAPAYLQYVEKSKKTSDCTALGSAMDALEICAADPALDWKNQTITITVSDAGVQFSGAPTATDAQLKSIIAADDGKLQGNWTEAGSSVNLIVTGQKETNGKVKFGLGSSGCASLASIKAISPALAGRIE